MYKCRACDQQWTLEQTYDHHSRDGITRSCGDVFCGATVDPVRPDELGTCEYCDGTLADDDTCPSCDLLHEATRIKYEAEYKREKASKVSKLTPGGKLVRGEKIDCLKSGQWWEWACHVEMPDGRTLYGTVQGSEHALELSTLELDTEGKEP